MSRAADDEPPPTTSSLSDLASRKADAPLTPPDALPALVPRSAQHRFDEATVYPYLETNVVAPAMEFSEEPFPGEVSDLSKGLYGPDSPFRHWQSVRRYVESLVHRRGYDDLVSYDTFVEQVVKTGSCWTVWLRRAGAVYDYWWKEEFDAVIVANGHFNVPFIPAIEGLDQLEKSRPGSVIHSKHFRGRELYRDKRVVIIGASVSAADIAFDLTSVAKSPVHAVVIGHTPNLYFGDEAFNHPGIRKQKSLVKVVGRKAYFQDGACVDDVDHFIFGTGYTWTLPFLPSVPVRNNRVPDLYQHVVWQHDPTLLFVGAVGAGLTFKIFEWQAVYAARLLAGRGRLPSLEERVQWERDRIVERGGMSGRAMTMCPRVRMLMPVEWQMGPSLLWSTLISKIISRPSEHSLVTEAALGDSCPSSDGNGFEISWMVMSCENRCGSVSMPRRGSRGEVQQRSKQGCN
ncbi:Thiol-specific monooxygenase [Teratosphaeria destructans]|uniref:Thiol-specific monooxygenase n=1 Tax=Teratosphaeria destructans TaxID=418781 RepID=A0A9W7W431_9PEZI|nr:Thiol-specific monooxygenase [Teratosphaeria destructans]